MLKTALLDLVFGKYKDKIMKKLLIIVVLLLISCKENYNSLGNDLYEKNGQFFICQRNVWYENDENGQTVRYYDSLCTLEKKTIALNEIIDVSSFRKKSKYYFDKNNVYVHNSFPGFFPELNAIKSRSKSIQFLGSDYYKIDNKIYFQSLEVKNANPKTFIVTDSTSNGYYYAKDDKNVFYKEKQIPKR